METKNQIYDSIRKLKKQFDNIGKDTSLLVLRDIREARKNMLIQLRDELGELLR